MVLPIGASPACCFRGYVTRESASHRARLAASLGRARSALVQQIQQSALGIQGANARATARALDLPEAFQDPLRVIARDGSLPPHTGCILPLDVRGALVHVAIQRPAAAPQIRRMKALGVIATVVPGFLWMAGDRYGLDKLGDEGIPIRRMLDGGVPVALSTDGVPYSMLWTAGEAIARWDDDGQRQLGNSQLTREEALRMAAQSGHRLTWNEDRYGSLEVGKVADMVVLAEDPLSCDPDRLKDIRVDRTFSLRTGATRRQRMSLADPLRPPQSAELTVWWCLTPRGRKGASEAR
jgi:hypothetical protein